MTFELICEDSGNYYHFNFTTKVKEAGDVYSDACNLFFAEVQIRRGGDWVVSCCCMIKPNDDGTPCSLSYDDCLCDLVVNESASFL